MEATSFSETGGHLNVLWAAGQQPPPPPAQLEIKKQYFVDGMTSVILRDLPFCQNQPLKSTYH
jgi:hypothetical protein